MVNSKKKLLKSENLPNFDTIETKSKFLIPNAKTAFNCLWLAFIKAPIFSHFDLKCHIQIKIDVLSYAIDKILN